jgi:hypothetical protein
MANIEIWLRDEYGQGAILGRFSDPKAAWEKAMSHLHAANCDNALTLAERLKSWECYLPVVLKDGAIDNSLFFDENKVGRSPRFCRTDGTCQPVEGQEVRMLANTVKTKDPWLIQDFKNRMLCKLDDPSLRNKSYISFRLS